MKKISQKYPSAVGKFTSLLQWDRVKLLNLRRRSNMIKYSLAECECDINFTFQIIHNYKIETIKYFIYTFI